MDATATKVNTDTILWFISMYNRFEKMTPAEGFQEIRLLFQDDVILAAHLCDQWRWKKRGFGQFYLNLDYPAQMRFLHRWEIKSEQDAAYLEKYFSNPMAPMFLEPPALVKAMHNVVLYFENHSICEQPSRDIKLQQLPAMRFRFGNSRNWARYILSLPVSERIELVSAIALHYQNEKA